MSGVCRDCKHWIKRNNGYGDCEQTVSLDNEPHPGISGAAYAAGGELVGQNTFNFAVLKTRPDFGCTQFEAKE